MSQCKKWFQVTSNSLTSALYSVVEDAVKRHIFKSSKVKFTYTFLARLQKLQKATVCFVMSVCPSVRLFFFFLENLMNYILLKICG